MTFRLRRPEFSNRVRPAAGRRFSHSCRRSEFSTATGSVVDPAEEIELSGSHPAGSRGGHWTFTRVQAGDRVRSSLVCLNRHTQFR